MYYRLIFGLLLIFILVAYIDTKSLKEYFDDTKILREYNKASKLIGIGIKDNDGNVTVQDVILNTPAQHSGVEVGDIVIDVDGKRAESAKMIKDYLNYVKKNKKIALTIQKPDNSIIEITLTPTSINNFE